MLDALNFLRISRFHFQLLLLNHYRRHHHDHHDHHNHCNHRHHRQSHYNCDRQVLFRPCAMCVPDLRLICEIMLVSEAFMEVWIGRLDQIISMTRQSRCPGSSSPSTPCARSFCPSRSTSSSSPLLSSSSRVSPSLSSSSPSASSFLSSSQLV